MALSAQYERKFRNLKGVYEHSYGVGAAATIWRGAMVSLSATGYIVPASDTAGYGCYGVAMENVDNSLGVDGALDVTVRRNDAHLCTTVGAAQSDLGKLVYCVDDEDVSLTDPGNGVIAGVIQEVVGATSVYVLIGDLTAELTKSVTYNIPFDWFKQTTGEDLDVIETAGAFNIDVAADVQTVVGEIANGAPEQEVSVGRLQIVMPDDYRAGTPVTARFRTVLFGPGTLGTCTLDLNAYEQTADGAVGGDICGTAAIAITKTIGNKDFTLTPTTLAPGDKLNLVVTSDISETAAANLQTRITEMEIIYLANDR